MGEGLRLEVRRVPHPRVWRRVEWSYDPSKRALTASYIIVIVLAKEVRSCSKTYNILRPSPTDTFAELNSTLLSITTHTIEHTS
jgi:hypothetical protein